MSYFALEGTTSKELITYEGKVIFHDNPRELLFLFEKSLSLGQIRIIQLPNKGLGRPLLRLRDHPGMASTTFPLDINEFRSEVK